MSANHDVGLSNIQWRASNHQGRPPVTELALGRRKVPVRAVTARKPGTARTYKCGSVKTVLIAPWFHWSLSDRLNSQKDSQGCFANITKLAVVRRQSRSGLQNRHMYQILACMVWTASDTAGQVSHCTFIMGVQTKFDWQTRLHIVSRRPFSRTRSTRCNFAIALSFLDDWLKTAGIKTCNAQWSINVNVGERVQAVAMFTVTAVACF